MMTRYGICPVCGSHIPEDRHDNGWVLCECGWLGSKNAEKYETDTHKTVMTWVLSLSIFFVVGFVHSAKWGNDSINVIPYQVKSMFGFSDQASTLAFAELSIKNRQISKGERLMTKWAEKENTTDAWEKLATLRTQMKDYNSAVIAFDKYYEAQGTNPLTMFHYAQVLEKLQRPDLAEKIYVHIVGLDKDTYQRTVVEELVRLLVNQQKLKEAQSILVQLSKPNMELPSHLIRQKEWIEQLLNDKPSSEEKTNKESVSI